MNQNNAKIDKITVARRKIEASIKIILEDEEYLCSYSLISAALEITQSLYEKNKTELQKREYLKSKETSREMQFTFLDDMKILIKDEHWDEFRKKYLNKTQNFLKHADKDADETIDEIEEEYILLKTAFAIRNYALVTGNSTPIMNLFMTYLYMVDGNKLKEKYRQQSPYKEMIQKSSKLDVSTIKNAILAQIYDYCSNKKQKIERIRVLADMYALQDRIK